MARKKSHKVRAGSVVVTVYPHRKGWQFAWRGADGRRRYTTRAKLSEAKEEARQRAIKAASLSLDLTDLTPDQVQIAREFLALDPGRADLEALKAIKEAGGLRVSEASDRFVAHKTAEKGRPTKYIRRQQIDLEGLAEFLSDPPLAAVTSEDLSRWVAACDAGAKRKNELRAIAGALWRWAQRQGFYPPGFPLPPDQLPALAEPHLDAKRILSPAELRFLMEHVSAEFAPWLALCAFSGLRSGEIFSWHKPPLRWEQIGDAHIDLKASQSKTGRRRLVPVLPALRRHLRPGKGPILARPANIGETGRLGRLMDAEWKREEGWPRNCLRHSYGSYRVAILRSVPEVAIEMGNSVSIIERHYLEVATREQAKAWFAV